MTMTVDTNSFMLMLLYAYELELEESCLGRKTVWFSSNDRLSTQNLMRLQAHQ
mgnify:CR=1 FL=1